MLPTSRRCTTSRHCCTSQAYFIRGLVRKDAQRKCHVVERIHRVEKCSTLKEHAELAPNPPQVRVGNGVDVGAVDQDAARVGSQETDNVLHQDTLARAAAADDGKGFAFPDGKRHVTAAQLSVPKALLRFSIRIMWSDCQPALTTAAQRGPGLPGGCKRSWSRPRKWCCVPRPRHRLRCSIPCSRKWT